MASRRQHKRQNRLGILSISAVVVTLLIVITIKSVQLNEKNELYIQKENQLITEKTSEEDRQAELEEYAKYVKTKKYIEEVAKDKLGLVYEDEIIFKSTN